MSFCIDRIAHAPQRPPHHLLAEQLRAERAYAENMRDGVGIPALGEHGDADDTLNVFAELAGLADRVHHLAQQVFVSEILGIAARESGRGIRP